VHQRARCARSCTSSAVSFVRDDGCAAGATVAAVADRGEVVPYRATAMLDGRLVADSRAAVRVEHDDAAPELWFPRADLVGDPPDDAWCEGTGELAGYVAFDHDAVDVEVIDGRDGDDERDVTTKRFPTWGDAADLIRLLDVQPTGERRTYRSPGRADWRRPVVEGSQLLGEAIVAASREVPGRRAVSSWMSSPDRPTHAPTTSWCSTRSRRDGRSPRSGFA
jgi:hypothetical protein